LTEDSGDGKEREKNAEEKLFFNCILHNKEVLHNTLVKNKTMWKRMPGQLKEKCIKLTPKKWHKKYKSLKSKFSEHLLKQKKSGAGRGASQLRVR
jgi:hypothetical protein